MFSSIPALVPEALGKPHKSEYEHGSTKVTVRHAIDISTPTELSMKEVLASRKKAVLEQKKKLDGFKPQQKHLAGSNLPLGDMTTTIDTSGRQTVHMTHWARKSEFGRVASNQDRSTPHVQMLRAWMSESKDGGFIATNYTGRADTEDRLKEQVLFMLEKEYELTGFKESEIRGLVKNSDGTYTYTYAVNSLTKHGKLQSLSNLNERKSLKKEHKLLSKDNTFIFQLSGRDIAVKLNPIHIHHNVSNAGEMLSNLFNDDISGKRLQKKINTKGYKALFSMTSSITVPEDILLANELKGKLEDSHLSLRERFIYTDMLQRILGIAIVDHCKSSVDRGGTAVAIGATNSHFLDNRHLLKEKSLKDLIDSQEYREMFFAHVCRSHQQTLPARFGKDEKGNLTGKKKLGLKMHGSLFTDSLPIDMVKETLWEKSPGVRKLVATVATIAYVILYPVILAFMFSIGHLLLGITQLGILGAKGKSIAGRMGAYHAIPYALTPWNIHKIVHKQIDYSNEQIKKYSILA